MGQGELEILVRDPILITGAARSGTSMTAGVFHLCGSWMGRDQVLEPRKSSFENKSLSGLLHSYLRLIGADPTGQHPLPSLVLPYPKLRATVESIISREGYAGGSPWFFKSSKLCLVWPIILEAFPGATWVIVRREEDQIIRSCLKTRFMTAFTDEAGWREWVGAYLSRFSEIKNKSWNVVEVWPTRMIKGDFSEMKEVIEHFHLQWDDDRVRDFVLPRKG